MGLAAYKPINTASRDLKRVNRVSNVATSDNKAALDALQPPTLRQTLMSSLDSSVMKNLLGQMLPSNSGVMNGYLGQASVSRTQMPVAQALKAALPKATGTATTTATAKQVASTPASFAPSPEIGNKPLLPAPSGLGPVKPVVQQFSREVATLFGNPLGMGGVGARNNKSDHPMGKAIDVMVTNKGSNSLAVGGEKERGDAIVAYSIRNAARLGVNYVIFNGYIYSSSAGWKPRPFSGDGTAGNGHGGQHGNHVHVSFNG